jgi:hypothetical protein
MMIKDPLDTEPTPYDVLGIEPGASVAQIQQALVRFMRDPKNRQKLPLAGQAAARLKNPVERAWIDLWLYDAPVLSEESDENVATALSELQTPPVYPVNELYSDIDAPNSSVDLTELQFTKMKMLELRRYDGLDAVKFFPPLDC